MALRKTLLLEGGWLAGCSSDDPFPLPFGKPPGAQRGPSAACWTRGRCTPGGTWKGRQSYGGTPAVLGPSMARMPLPVKFCPGTAGTNRDKRRHRKADAYTAHSHSKLLRCSSSGSFPLKDKCSACDQTDLYLFTFLSSQA